MAAVGGFFISMNDLELNSAVADHFSYNSQYEVLICRPCEHALTPGLGAQRHLRDHHGFVSKKMRRALIKHIGGLALKELENVITSDSDDAPIDGLSVLNGNECRTCEYVCPSEDNMVVHVEAQHE